MVIFGYSRFFQNLIVNKAGKIGEEGLDIRVLLLAGPGDGLVSMLFQVIYIK